jgi:hypothetical protein
MTPSPSPAASADAVMNSATFVETLTAWSTLFAAIATAASVVFIAWQIRLTRKSVESTDRTLDIARMEFDRGRHLEVEAQKSRIDSEMPRLFVTHTGTHEHPYWGDESEPDEYSPTKLNPKRVPEGFEFHVPRDASRVVSIRFYVQIANDGPGRAQVYLDAYSAPTFGERRTMTLKAAEQSHWACWRTLTVQQWIDVYEMRKRGTSDEVSAAQVIYIYPGDVSAIERHEVSIGGAILEPDPARLGIWRVGKFTGPLTGDSVGVGVAVQPFTRTYYASRSQDRLFEIPAPSGE